MDENDRYIEYLQKGMIRPGLEKVFDNAALSFWINENKAKLKARIPDTDIEDSLTLLGALEREISDFVPNTKYDLVSNAAIFSPILEAVIEFAKATGLKPVRKVQICTATDSTVSASARPTLSEHLLFIGPGTSSFCNYWAKVFSALVSSIAYDRGLERIGSVEEARRAIEQLPQLLFLAIQLTIRHATWDTLLGFGVVDPPNANGELRMQLLRAMELFVVAHEYAHFVVYERGLDDKTLEEAPSSEDIEVLCDRMAIAISRNSVAHKENYPAFCGVGAIILLRAVECSKKVRQVLSSGGLTAMPAKSQFEPQPAEKERSHPDETTRIGEIRQQIVSTTHEQDLENDLNFFDEYDAIAKALNDRILESVTVACRRQQMGAGTEDQG